MKSKAGFFGGSHQNDALKIVSLAFNMTPFWLFRLNLWGVPVGWCCLF